MSVTWESIHEGDSLPELDKQPGVSQLVKYAGANSSIAVASVVEEDSISAWGWNRGLVTFCGGWAPPTDNWVQVQSRQNSDYNVALYQTSLTGNRQTFRSYTTLYSWLAASNGWTIDAFDSSIAFRTAAVRQPVCVTSTAAKTIALRER